MLGLHGISIRDSHVLLQVRSSVKGFTVGSRYYTPADGPVEIDNSRAGDIVRAGLADPVVKLPHQAAQRAADPRREAGKR